jgi:hypothetical protein
MTSRFNPGLSVRYAQAKNRVSNRALAKHMGVAAIQVTRWRAATDMRLSRLESLATFFGMTITEFLDLGLEETSGIQDMSQPVVSVSENQVVVNV